MFRLMFVFGLLITMSQSLLAQEGQKCDHSLTILKDRAWLDKYDKYLEEIKTQHERDESQISALYHGTHYDLQEASVKIQALPNNAQLIRQYGSSMPKKEFEKRNKILERNLAIKDASIIGSDGSDYCYSDYYHHLNGDIVTDPVLKITCKRSKFQADKYQVSYTINLITGVTTAKMSVTSPREKPLPFIEFAQIPNECQGIVVRSLGYKKFYERLNGISTEININKAQSESALL